MLIQSEVVIVLVTVLLVGIVVVFHYEVIQLLNHWIARRKGLLREAVRDRPIVLTVMFVLLLAHVVEIWLFGGAFYLLLEHEGYGDIVGYPEMTFLDCVYFSVTNYTTVGWGDLVPTGDLRFLAGTESLVGFMAITWSASFGYLVMARTFKYDSEE